VGSAVGTCFLNSEEVKAYIWNSDKTGARGVKQLP